MSELHQFVRVDFYRFKAFRSFSINLRHFNILVGPNNSGKSTILTAFRILAVALRRAGSRTPEMLRGPQGKTLGYKINLTGISVAAENIYYNYDEAEAAYVKFTLINRSELLLYFPERDACYLIADADGKTPRSPKEFKALFNCPVGFVPILGPVEHEEELFQMEAARSALYSFTAARNFRNIWFHFPEKFDEFQTLLSQTWPGMDIKRPEVKLDLPKRKLVMFCPEERIPREIFWAGFGFQVWCQMLTHLIQGNDKSIFLIDEPDIYLHSDLQRQLLALLRNLGPDIILATHSTEIVSEAEHDEIVLINKKKVAAKRIKNPSELGSVFSILGSNLNPTLTQLAKTRRVVFVEGKDFQIISKFARKLGRNVVGNRSHFAVVTADGFNPERIRSLKSGMETTLGGRVASATVMDRDYRCQKECDSIALECSKFCQLVYIHKRKEIENFLLVPSALDRAAATRVKDHAKRAGNNKVYSMSAKELLLGMAEAKKNHVLSRFLAAQRQFVKSRFPHLDDSTISESSLHEFEIAWSDVDTRLALLPGKEILAELNQALQQEYGVSVTVSGIVDAMVTSEIPVEMIALVDGLSRFAESKVA